MRRARRALEVARVARRSGLLQVLRVIGVVGERPATREGATKFRSALEEFGTTYIKLGQLLSSRPDLLPDPYIEELGKLVDSVPPVPFAELDRARGPRRGRVRLDRRRAASNRVDRADSSPTSSKRISGRSSTSSRRPRTRS
jgi:predicted unusual protein kinase regulating ubiquinone biosynthesis (AarF/ABC1/UbiB family)